MFTNHQATIISMCDTNHRTIQVPHWNVYKCQVSWELAHANIPDTKWNHCYGEWYDWSWQCETNGSKIFINISFSLCEQTFNESQTKAKSVSLWSSTFDQSLWQDILDELWFDTCYQTGYLVTSVFPVILTPGRFGRNFQNVSKSPKTCYGLDPWVLLNLISDECQRTLMMIDQHQSR